MRTRFLLFLLGLLPFFAGAQTISLVKQTDTTLFLSNTTSITKYTAYGNSLYFVNNQDLGSYNNTRSGLWRTDGMQGGTELIKNIKGKIVSGLITYNGRLFFIMRDNPRNLQLWTSDGTAAGTQVVREFNESNIDWWVYSDIEQVNGKMYFLAADTTDGRGLYASDGTAAGTNLIMGSNFYRPMLMGEGGGVILTAMNNRLYFSATTNSAAIRPPYCTSGLWSSDGTAVGTYPLTPDSLNVVDLVTANDRIYFSSLKGFGVSDGTVSGTRILDTALNRTSFAQPPSIHAGRSFHFGQDYLLFNNELFFRSYNTGNNSGLYATDGSSVRLVKQISTFNPFSGISYSPFIHLFLTEMNGAFYFSADSVLYRSDGTTAGTVPVIPASQPGKPNFPMQLMAYNNRLYFRTYDTVRSDIWSTDGTAAGTIKYTFPGANSNTTLNNLRSYVNSLFGWNNKIFYKAVYDTTSYVSLYKLDLTPNAVSGVNGKEDDIAVYPVPSSGTVQVVLKEGMYDRLSVSDQVGKTVMTKMIGTGATTVPLNMSHLLDGIYYLQLSGTEAQITRKLVLQR